ncbi:MAG: hypothetical protein DSY82_09605 [Flavobacteriia bacterium]|nr:MAG: hypothetical protein DSY82_09605 [Flavobacteriia bacterium]
MNSLQLKNSIIRKISQIDDADQLKMILEHIEPIHQKAIDRAGKIPMLSNNKSDINNDKENFNEYIKEWLKEM